MLILDMCHYAILPHPYIQALPFYPCNFKQSIPPINLGAAILSVQSFSHICNVQSLSNVNTFIQDGRARQTTSYSFGVLLCVQTEIYMIPGESAHVLICSTLFNTEDSQGTGSTIQHNNRYHGISGFSSHITVWCSFTSLVCLHGSSWYAQRKYNSFHRPHLLHVSGC